MLRGAVHAAGGAAVLGGASTGGDWIWANFLRDGAVLPGVVHGLLFFLLLAVVLASAIGTQNAWRRLLVSLPPVGLLLAASFYPIALVIGYLGGLLVTWVAMWLLLAILLRWVHPDQETVQQAFGRGALAAVLSGLAFWAISGIWTQPATAPEPLSLERFAYWTFAFFPGLAALLLGQRVDERNRAELV